MQLKIKNNASESRIILNPNGTSEFLNNASESRIILDPNGTSIFKNDIELQENVNISQINNYSLNALNINSSNTLNISSSTEINLDAPIVNIRALTVHVGPYTQNGFIYLNGTVYQPLSAFNSFFSTDSTGYMTQTGF